MSVYHSIRIKLFYLKLVHFWVRKQKANSQLKLSVNSLTTIQLLLLLFHLSKQRKRWKLDWFSFSFKKIDCFSKFSEKTFIGIVVYIVVNLTFKVIFTPLGYVLSMAKRLHFFGLGFLLFHPLSSILVLYFLSEKRGRNKIYLRSKYKLCRTSSVLQISMVFSVQL